jgi:hypothetical protein
MGVEISSGPHAELTLQWHKAFGLLSLLATVAALIGFVYSKQRLSAPFRFWTFLVPRADFRASVHFAHPTTGLRLPAR